MFRTSTPRRQPRQRVGILCYGVPGGFAEVPFDKAKTEPTATQAPATTPTLISRERLLRCFAGAIATPIGRAAGEPFGKGNFAPAAPEGTESVFWVCAES